MFIDKSNEVLMNHYRKQEIIQAKKRLEEEKMSIIQVLQLTNKEVITTDELLEALYISKEQLLDEIINTTQSVSENTEGVSTNTTNVPEETPMEIARKYKKYYEEYSHNREQICIDKKIANGTWHCMNFVKRGKTECPKCKAIKETIIENCFVEAYKILCSDKGEIVEKFINRMNNIITENSSDKLIENFEAEKQKLNSKMNKLIDLSLDNAIDRDTFLERKEKLQAKIEQLNMKQEKLMLDETNNTNRKLSLSKIRKFLETGEIVTEFDKDAFEILIKQVIVGGYDEKENADPHAITFVLKNDNIINSKEYLQSSYNVGKLNLQESNHPLRSGHNFNH